MKADRDLSNDSKHMFNIHELYSFKQLIEKPNRVSLSASSIIDRITTTNPRNIVKSGVLEVPLSDHYMAYCTRKFNRAVEKGRKIIKTIKIKVFSEEAF